jgi:hypothetical protein
VKLGRFVADQSSFVKANGRNPVHWFAGCNIELIYRLLHHYIDTFLFIDDKIPSPKEVSELTKSIESPGGAAFERSINQQMITSSNANFQSLSDREILFVFHDVFDVNDEKKKK